MSLKELLKAKKAEQETSGTRRIYADINIEVDAGLERIATAASKTKKAMIEWLITNAVEEFDAMEKETNKRAKAKK